MRRSTRTRSASEEARVTKKPKPAPRAKGSTLPAVQESPGKRSSALVSGTTVQNSIAMSKERQEMAESLVDGLQELWTISDQLLSKLVPEQLDEEAVEQMTKRLETSLRFQKDIQLQLKNLKTAMSKYPGMPTLINVANTNLQIFGQQNVERTDQAVLRPDDVLYRANLAYALGILASQIIDGMDDFDSEEMLRMFFGTFSRVKKSNQKSTPGSTSYLKATFDLALELQTKVFWDTLDDFRARGTKNIDEVSELTKIFYEDSALRGWDVDGLRKGELKQDQRQAIIERVTMIHPMLGSTENQDKIRKELSSDATLIYQCLSWANIRNGELLGSISEIPDKVLGIQESIDKEIKRLGISAPEDTIHLQTDPAQHAFVRPEALSRVKASIQGTTRSKVLPSSSRRQQSSEEASAAAALDHQIEQELESSNRNDDSFQPALFVGDEGFEDNSDSESVVRDTEHYEPTEEQKMRLSQHVAMKTKQANKENLPHRGAKAAQLLNQGQTSSENSSNQAVGHINKGKNKRDRSAYEEEEEDYNTDLSQDGDNNDEDDGFQTQKTPEKAHRQRPQQLPPPKPTPSRVTFTNSAGNGSSQPNSRTVSQAEPSRTQRTDMYHAINLEAKQRVSEMMPRKEIRPRVPWSDEEIECLLQYIEEYGTSWAKMKEHDDSSLGRKILHQRDNVALKDKARNIRLDFMKANRPLPPGLELVTLRAADKNKLKGIGMWDDSYDN